MDINQLLHDHSNEIIEEACSAMKRMHLRRYEQAGPEHIHQRVKGLFVLTARSVKEKNVGPLIAHAEQVAQERFKARYDLWEVQTAFNVLEEIIWARILKELPPESFAEALGLVSTVLGVGKDTLARRYVSLASNSKTPSLNFESLFSGTQAT
jgi:hypothetical protein